MVVAGFSINMRMVSLGLDACEAEWTDTVTAFGMRANEMKDKKVTREVGKCSNERKGTKTVTAIDTRANEIDESVMRTDINKNPKANIKGTDPTHI